MHATKLVGVSSSPTDRTSLWTYYERRAPDYDGGVSGAEKYFSSLGVEADPKVIAAEHEQVTHTLGQLPPARFLDVGAGPGVFTTLLPGRGCALDQSEAALQRLRRNSAGVPMLRGDADRPALAANAITEVCRSSLWPPRRRGRVAFLTEVRHVADELVILDSGRPAEPRKNGSVGRLPTAPVTRSTSDTLKSTSCSPKSVERRCSAAATSSWSAPSVDQTAARATARDCRYIAPALDGQIARYHAVVIAAEPSGAPPPILTGGRGQVGQGRPARATSTACVSTMPSDALLAPS